MHLILASASPRRAELLRAAGYTFEIVVADIDESRQLGESPSTYVRRLAADKSAAVLSRLTADLPPSPDGFGEPRRSSPLLLASGGGKVCTTPGTPSEVRTTRGAASELVQAVPPPLAGDTRELRRGSPKAPGEGGRPADVVVLGADTTVVVDGETLGKPRNDEDGREMLRRLSGKTHQVLTGISLRQGAYEVGRVESTDVTFRALTFGDIEWYAASGEGRDKAGGYAIQGLASRFIPAIAGSYSNVVGLPVAAVAELLRSLLASNP